MKRGACITLGAAGLLLLSLLTGPQLAGARPDGARPAEGLQSDRPGHDAALDTLRYVEIVDGHALGSWRTWREPGDTLVYENERHYHFYRTERLVLDEQGLPVHLETTGRIHDGIPWFERFERDADMARWITPRARGDTVLTGPAFYASVFPAHDVGVIARALLGQPSRTLPLLPDDRARIEMLDERTVEVDDRRRTVRMYAVHGIDPFPRYVWLDENQVTFADAWSVREGWKDAFPRLRVAMDNALAAHRRRLADELRPRERTRPLVIRNARLFDPDTKEVREGTTIVVERERIAAVGPDVDVQADADVIDAAGRMVLPGLWDMHAHLILPAEQDPMEYRGFAPLHLAAGVTTVRDMGSHVESVVTLREAIEAGEAVGPHILHTGFIYGPEAPYDGVGIRVRTTDEAQSAVDHFAELGFEQIKLYVDTATLVNEIIARARQLDMRLIGHMPFDMTTRQAIEAGYDELSHIWWLVWTAKWTENESIAAGENWTTWHQVLAELTPDERPVRETVDLLAERGVAVDPTIGMFLSDSTPPEFIAGAVGRLPAPLERRLRHKTWAVDYFPRSPLARPAREQAVENLQRLLAKLHEAGVRILPGTDSWPGFGLHFELERYVEAGIPPADVLTLATLDAARAMGMDDELGSIAPGKRADLIIVDGNPDADISDIRRVETVIKDGRVFDAASIYNALGVEPCCNE